MSTERRPELGQYSITMIKPDAHRDYLSQMIIADLEEAGLCVVYRKEMRLEPHEAESTYEEHRDSINYPYMVESLLLKDGYGEQYPCMLLVLKTESDNALELNQKVKGQADKSGIRAKYRMYFWHELEEMGYHGEDLSLILARNRLHVPDDHDMMVEILGLLLTEKDIEKIAEREGELADIIRRFQDSQSKSLVLLKD